MIKIIFLGTSCMVPTKERNVTSIYLEYDGEGILFDCGEGTQRQLNIAGISRSKIKKVFISHWHGDHVSGLVGLIQTIGNDESPPKLTIFGPKETNKRMEHLMQTCAFDAKVELDIKEFHPKKVEKIFDNDKYIIETAPLDHNVPCIGYAFIEKDKRKMKLEVIRKLGIPDGPLLGKLQDGKDIEFKDKIVTSEETTYIVKGKKVAIILDTQFCDSSIKLAKDADLLICEAAYASSHEEKAENYKHMTAKQAAYIAHNSNSKELILTHFSQRYKTAEPIEKEAKTIFPNSRAAFDFMKVKI